MPTLHHCLRIAGLCHIRASAVLCAVHTAAVGSLDGEGNGGRGRDRGRGIPVSRYCHLAL